MKRVQQIVVWSGCLAAVAVLGHNAKEARADDRECVLWPIYNYGTSILYYCELHPSDCDDSQAEYKILSNSIAYPCDCADPDGMVSPDCCGTPRMGRPNAVTFDGLRYKFNRNTEFSEQPKADWVSDNTKGSYAEVLSSGDHKYRHVMATTPAGEIPAIMYRFEISVVGDPRAHPKGTVKTFYVAFQCEGSANESVACQTPLDGTHAFAGTYTHNGHDYPLLLLTAR